MQFDAEESCKDKESRKKSPAQMGIMDVRSMWTTPFTDLSPRLSSWHPSLNVIFLIGAGAQLFSRHVQHPAAMKSYVISMDL